MAVSFPAPANDKNPPLLGAGAGAGVGEAEGDDVGRPQIV